MFEPAWTSHGRCCPDRAVIGGPEAPPIVRLRRNPSRLCPGGTNPGRTTAVRRFGLRQVVSRVVTRPSARAPRGPDLSCIGVGPLLSLWCNVVADSRPEPKQIRTPGRRIIRLGADRRSPAGSELVSITHGPARAGTAHRLRRPGQDVFDGLGATDPPRRRADAGTSRSRHSLRWKNSRLEIEMRRTSWGVSVRPRTTSGASRARSQPPPSRVEDRRRRSRRAVARRTRRPAGQRRRATLTPQDVRASSISAGVFPRARSGGTVAPHPPGDVWWVGAPRRRNTSWPGRRDREAVPARAGHAVIETQIAYLRAIGAVGPKRMIRRPRPSDLLRLGRESATTLLPRRGGVQHDADKSGTSEVRAARP